MTEKQLWPGWRTAELIGSGGFGKVYRIEKEDASGRYSAALKVISIPASADDYQAYQDDGYDDESITSIFREQLEGIVSEFSLMSQFKGESNIVSYENHKIVRKEDACGWDVYIKMELLTSLPKYLKDHSMSEQDTVKLAKDICSALTLCQKKNIIHRDIKPQNIFVNEYGHFKLGDFGIARTMEQTTHATKIGTYNFMAPEVYTGKQYNHTADIYSLGIVLYWLLNDRKYPFEPTERVPTSAERNEAQAKRFSGAEIEKPVYCGDAFWQIIRRACCYDPAGRYTGAEEMLEALEGVNGSCGDCQKDKRSAEVTEGFWTEPAYQRQKQNEGKPPYTSEWSGASGSGERHHGTDSIRNSVTGEPEGIKSPTDGKTTCDWSAQRKSAADSAASKPACQLCPVCAGRKTQTFVLLGHGYYNAPCAVCHGTGVFSGNSTVYETLRKNREEQKRKVSVKGTVNENCPLCSGDGMVTAFSHIGIVRKMYSRQDIQCPMCFGKRMKLKRIPVPPDHAAYIGMADDIKNIQINEFFDSYFGNN